MNANIVFLIAFENEIRMSAERSIASADELIVVEQIIRNTDRMKNLNSHQILIFIVTSSHFKDNMLKKFAL